MGRAALQLWVLVSAMLVVRPIFKGKWSMMQEMHQPWYNTGKASGLWARITQHGVGYKALTVGAN